MTAGGIVGEVISSAQQMKDGGAAVTMDDRVTIKSGETRLIVERGRIAKIMRKTDTGGKGVAPVAVLDIRVLGDPVLRERTRPVERYHR